MIVESTVYSRQVTITIHNVHIVCSGTVKDTYSKPNFRVMNKNAKLKR